MKKYFKKLTAILVVLVMLLASVPASAQTTSTAQKRSVYSQVNVQKGYILGSYNLNKTSVKITQSRKLGTVKSTKRSDGYTWYYFYPAKAGNTTITVVAKDKLSGSKAETTKYPFTIVKYQNPVSSVKIRNTNISGNKLNKTDRLYLSYSKYSRQNNTLKITAKKGWALRSLVAFDKSGNQLNIEEIKKFKAFGGKGNYILKAEFFNEKRQTSELIEIVFK